MKYFNVTMMDKGKKRRELIKAKDKMSAIKSVKQKFPYTQVIKSEETSAPAGEILGNFFKGSGNHLKPKFRSMTKYQPYDK
jgi:hypothetical protein